MKFLIALLISAISYSAFADPTKSNVINEFTNNTKLKLTAVCSDTFNTIPTEVNQPQAQKECDLKAVAAFEKIIGTCKKEDFDITSSFDQNHDNCITCEDFYLWLDQNESEFLNGARAIGKAGIKALGCNKSQAEADAEIEAKLSSYRALTFEEKIKQSKKLQQLGEREEALVIAELALDDARKSNDTKMLIEALRNIEFALTNNVLAKHKPASVVEPIIREEIELISKDISNPFLPFDLLVLKGRLLNNLRAQGKDSEAEKLKLEIEKSRQKVFKK